MYQYNGHYGYHYCNVEGQKTGKTHSFFPFNQQAEIRETSMSDQYTLFADCLAVERTYGPTRNDCLFEATSKTGGGGSIQGQRVLQLFFYVGPIAMKVRLNDILYMHFLQLSFGVRLLLETTRYCEKISHEQQNRNKKCAYDKLSGDTKQ